MCDAFMAENADSNANPACIGKQGPSQHIFHRSYPTLSMQADFKLACSVAFASKTAQTGRCILRIGTKKILYGKFPDMHQLDETI